MTLAILLTIIIPLIERITQAINTKITFFKEKVDARITAAVIAIAIAFLYPGQINLFAMSGAYAGVVVNLPVWLTVLVSGFILSLGASAVNWLFNQVNINKDTTKKNIADNQASSSQQAGF